MPFFLRYLWLCKLVSKYLISFFFFFFVSLFFLFLHLYLSIYLLFLGPFKFSAFWNGIYRIQLEIHLDISVCSPNFNSESPDFAIIKIPILWILPCFELLIFHLLHEFLTNSIFYLHKALISMYFASNIFGCSSSFFCTTHKETVLTHYTDTAETKQ